MNATSIPTFSGVLPIDKAPGMTSHDVVARVRRALWPSKVKVGHAGTLDPDATGLLLVCIGPATRLADLLADQGKVYHAEFVLGATTTTEDASGEVLVLRDASNLARVQVEEALQALTGQIQQTPPMVSAVHHEGKRLYELARQGIEVERAARTIIVEKIELLRFEHGREATGEFIVECGKGTYVRTLCADLGERLGAGGYMKSLRRLKIGAFDVADAVPIDDVTADVVSSRTVPASDAVGFLPLRMLTEAERTDVLLGRPLSSRSDWEKDGLATSRSGYIRLVDTTGLLVALAVEDAIGGQLWPKKVLTQ